MSPLEIAVLVTLVGAALMSGSFFVFSVMVMPALARRPDAEAVAAMQSMNAVAETPPFLAAFLGSSLAAIVTLVMALIDGHAVLVLAATVFLIGSFGVTVAGNVPLNKRLDSADPASTPWLSYARPWSVWNATRALASTITVALCAIGLWLPA